MDHIKYLLAANEVARKARENGNTPFGAVLVDSEGQGPQIKTCCWLFVSNRVLCVQVF